MLQQSRNEQVKKCRLSEIFNVLV